MVVVVKVVELQNEQVTELPTGQQATVLMVGQQATVLEAGLQAELTAGLKAERMAGLKHEWVVFVMGEKQGQMKNRPYHSQF